MAIYDELEELTGRLTALKINFPDFEVRLNDSIDMYQRALSGGANPQLLAWMGNDMLEMYNYLRECYENVPEVKKEVKPILSLLKGLTEPV